MAFFKKASTWCSSSSVARKDVHSCMWASVIQDRFATEGANKNMGGAMGPPMGPPGGDGVCAATPQGYALRFLLVYCLRAMRNATFLRRFLCSDAYMFSFGDAVCEYVSGDGCDHCNVPRLNLSTSSPASSDLASCDWSFFASAREVLFLLLLLLPDRTHQTRLTIKQ